MADDTEKKEKTSAEVQEEIQKRKDWFFECQLRRLNLDSFLDVNEFFPDALLELVSEVAPFDSPIGSRIKQPGRVYLDSEKPVWTIEEREQRAAFAKSVLGRDYYWLDNRSPKKIIERLSALKMLYEGSYFFSKEDDIEELNRLERKNASADINLPHAISRVEITSDKPWLIFEMYNTINGGPEWTDDWLLNAELFISNYEKELLQILGKTADSTIDFDKETPEIYRSAMQSLMQQSLVQNPSEAVKVSFKREENGKTVFDARIETAGFDLNNLSVYPFSKNLLYWSKAFDLSGIYLNTANSDMGLCLLIRAVYLYGTLPHTLGADNQLTWRKKREADKKLGGFFSKKTEQIFARNNPDYNERFEKVKSKMITLLELKESNPRCASLQFSLLNAEVTKQAILGYKFWLDEPYRVYDYHGEEQNEKKAAGINKARKDAGKGEEVFTEMEYWSENHYIMFASSEYLAGQLWQEEKFQPAADFLKPEDKNKLGVLSGKERMERGKARLLKWLNNKLMFGWTEFNSSGYYREHLYALLNLADFSLDDEVRRKSIIVTDLLLFDVIRFLHKGSMGACGGRSQFKFKNKGWDNASGDLVEILLGTRGMFLDHEGEIGCIFSTSTYKIPEVLLQIGSFPPETGFVDRSRVSLNFEEALKYGIRISQTSDQNRSIENGFSPKKNKHFKFLKKANDVIEKTHTDYGAMEDDTTFWWSLSAFYNKEILLNTIACVDQFKLEKSKAFSMLGAIKKLGIVATKEGAADTFSVLLDGSTRSRANIYTYRNRDVMLSSIQNFRTGQWNFQSNVNQATISTEINVFTTSGFTGLSISDILSALGGAAGGFLGVSLLNTAFAAGTGGIVAAAGAAAGAIVAVALNEYEVEGSNVNHEDGPGWWTGYWSLPMVVQHENASIIAYDFYGIHRRLTDYGCHVWFPKNAFDQVEERRTSAYDDDDFFLLDLENIGRKGFWIFGKKLHRKDLENPDASEEGYIGVFSMERPEWQNQDSDFYRELVEEKSNNALTQIKDDINNKLDQLENRKYVGYIGRQIIEIVALRSVNQKLKSAPHMPKEQLYEIVKRELAQSKGVIIVNNLDMIMELVNLYFDQHNHLRIWKNPLPVDYFSDRDGLVDGKNIWIIQLGNKNEYGSFDNFKDRVSRAKVEISDSGDMKCVYHIPKPDGSSQTLSLKYKGECKLAGKSLQMDYYPRFENPFVRGKLVEWGQREYVIEYKGKFLLHDFSDMENPIRSEIELSSPENADTIKGLVIYLQTGDEEMEIDTVTMATVHIGCQAAAVSEVIAAGKVDEDTFHDSEWIFFDMSAKATPDMTIDIYHNLSRNIPWDEASDTEWKMSFTLKALMGDRSLRGCSLSYSYFHFEGDKRNSGPFPFSVQIDSWHPWSLVEENKRFQSWQIARHSRFDRFYFNYCDLLGIDENDGLWHRCLQTCPDQDNSWVPINTTVPGPDFAGPHSLCSISTQPGNLYLFVVSQGKFFVRWRSPNAEWTQQPWTELTVKTIPSIFGVPDPFAAPVPVMVSSLSHVVVQNSSFLAEGIDICINGADGNFYMVTEWLPGYMNSWRKIETVSSFSLLWGATFEISNDFLFALNDQQGLWCTAIALSSEDWQKLTPVWLSVASFTVANNGTFYKIIVTTTLGEIWSAGFTSPGESTVWERVGQANNFLVSDQAKVSWTIPTNGHLKIFVPGTDGKVYTTWWKEGKGWENTWISIGEERNSFQNKITGKIEVITRIRNQIEIFTESKDKGIWKSWWS